MHNKINGKAIEIVHDVTEDDNDDAAVKRKNIVRAREKWASMRGF